MFLPVFPPQEVFELTLPRPKLITLSFIEFNGNSTAGFDACVEVIRHLFVAFFDVVHQPGEAHLGHPADASQRDSFKQQRVDGRFRLVADALVGWVADKLTMAAGALVVLFAVVEEVRP